MFMVLMVYFMILSDYDATAVNDILDIPKYLMKKKIIQYKNVWVYQNNVCCSNIIFQLV